MSRQRSTGNRLRARADGRRGSRASPRRKGARHEGRCEGRRRGEAALALRRGRRGGARAPRLRGEDPDAARRPLLEWDGEAARRTALPRRGVPSRAGNAEDAGARIERVAAAAHEGRAGVTRAAADPLDYLTCGAPPVPRARMASDAGAISFCDFVAHLGVELEPGQRVAAKIAYDGA